MLIGKKSSIVNKLRKNNWLLCALVFYSQCVLFFIINLLILSTLQWCEKVNRGNLRRRNTILGAATSGKGGECSVRAKRAEGANPP